MTKEVTALQGLHTNVNYLKSEDGHKLNLSVKKLNKIPTKQMQLWCDATFGAKLRFMLDFYDILGTHTKELDYFNWACKCKTFSQLSLKLWFSLANVETKLLYVTNTHVLTGLIIKKKENWMALNSFEANLSWSVLKYIQV